MKEIPLTHKIVAAGIFFMFGLTGCDQPTKNEQIPTPTIPPTETFTSNTPTTTPIQEIDDSSTPAQYSTPNPTSTPDTTEYIRIVLIENQPSYTDHRESIPQTRIDWLSMDLVDPIHVQNWEDIILENADRFDIPPEVIAAVIDTESHGRIDGIWAELEGDGVGLMGIMPQERGFPNRPTRLELFDPEINIAWGTSILWEIYNNEHMGNGNWYDTLLWYNAGLEDKLIHAEPYADLIYQKLNWETPDETETHEPLLEERILN